MEVELTAAQVEAIRKTTQLRHIGLLEQVPDTALFLLSSKAAYMTG